MIRSDDATVDGGGGCRADDAGRAVSVEPMEAFSPIFVVGPGRSGSTMLAVILDRHSRLAIPPETHFFAKFVPGYWAEMADGSRAAKVDAALAYERIADLGLNREQVIRRFEAYEASPAGLCRAILECYAAKHGKVRPGEKSPAHIDNVDQIFEAFPSAKVIVIMRDGRDVVRSTKKLNWVKSSRRLGVYCARWVEIVRIVDRLFRRYSSECVHLVKYEDLARHPERELERICEFVGESFEIRQLDPTIETDAVPTWEDDWKAKARTVVDPSRIEAWRRSDDQVELWFMNSIMGRDLCRMGYTDTSLRGCPWRLRLRFGLIRMVLWPPLRRFMLLSLRLARRFGLDPNWGMPT